MNLSKLALGTAAILIAALFLTGCGAKPAALSDEQVSAVTENILTSLDKGDLQSFTRDMDEKLKAAYTEEQFNGLRALLAENVGEYRSKSAPQLINDQAYAAYSFPCKYEKEDVVVRVVFPIDGTLVSGLWFDSESLRKLSQ